MELRSLNTCRIWADGHSGVGNRYIEWSPALFTRCPLEGPLGISIWPGCFAGVHHLRGCLSIRRASGGKANSSTPVSPRCLIFDQCPGQGFVPTGLLSPCNWHDEDSLSFPYAAGKSSSWHWTNNPFAQLHSSCWLGRELSLCDAVFLKHAGLLRFEPFSSWL